MIVFGCIELFCKIYGVFFVNKPGQLYYLITLLLFLMNYISGVYSNTSAECVSLP